MPNKLSEVTNKEARKTALVVAIVLLLIAGFSFYRNRLTTAEVFAAIATLLALIGLFVPPAAKRFHIVWMTIAFALGWINSRILLTILFFLIFVPYGLISKLFRRDPLKRRDEKRESYWIPRENPKYAKERFERLF